MKSVKKICCLLLAAILALSAVGCSSGAKEENVDLEAGSSYRMEGTAGEDWTYETGDEGIALVFRDKYINGISEGKTDITAKKGSEKVVYHVSVTGGEEYKLLDAPDIKDGSVFLGCGFNALKHTDYITDSDLILQNVLLPISFLEDPNGYQVGGHRIRQNRSRSDFYESIYAKSTEDYEKQFSDKVGGKLDLGAKTGIIGVGVSGKYEKLGSESKKTAMSYNSLNIITQRSTFYLDADTSTLGKMIQNANPSGWAMLTGEDGSTPEQFFNRYGTHMLVSVNMGGKILIDYTMESKDDKTTSEDLMNIAGDINAKIGPVSVGVDGNYSADEVSKALTGNFNIHSVARAIGGAVDSATMITGFDTFKTFFPSWLDGIVPETYAFIGVPETGLVPMWELLDRNQYADRIQELSSYYEEQAQLYLKQNQSKA